MKIWNSFHTYTLLTLPVNDETLFRSIKFLSYSIHLLVNIRTTNKDLFCMRKGPVSITIHHFLLFLPELFGFFLIHSLIFPFNEEFMHKIRRILNRINQFRLLAAKATNNSILSKTGDKLICYLRKSALNQP